MNLADLIDLDRQLSLDPHAGDPVRRLERDRRIGRMLLDEESGGSGGDEALLLEWKKNVSEASDVSLGTLLAAAVRWTSAGLILLGLLLGASASAALLRYDGSQPINVLFFLGAIVGGQLLLLPLLLASFLFRDRLRHGFRLVRGVLHQVLVLLARWWFTPEKSAKLKADLGTLLAENSLYARAQGILALSLSQVFGVAFNAAVAATLLFFVVFSDLTFSWGTTMQVEPERIHQITSVLSAPWAAVFPQARPSLELVEATRFVRMEGAFATSEPDAALRAGGWWPFLLAATIFYGMLPRLLALGGSALLLRRELRRALAGSSRIQALKERLETPLVSVDPGSGVAGSPEIEPVAKLPESPKLERGLSLGAVFWAYDDRPPEDLVASWLEERAGVSVVGRWEAGGIDAREDRVLAEVEVAKQENRLEGAAVFFEPFEPPKADARRFLVRLREALGPSAPIVIFLAEFSDGTLLSADQEDWEAWDRSVRSAGDPFLFMEGRQSAA